jgi:hypothetical protein
MEQRTSHVPGHSDGDDVITDVTVSKPWPSGLMFICDGRKLNVELDRATGSVLGDLAELLDVSVHSIVDLILAVIKAERESW